MAGTIADKIQGILDAKADIASAIEEKGGTVPDKLSEYGDAIRDLPSGDQEPADVEFIDYDGTVLYKYTFEEANALTALPAYSDRPGYGTGYTMVNEGWNYTLAEVKSHAQVGIKTTVGCTYTTSDGATRIHVHIEGTTADDRKFGFTMAQKTSARVHLAWGDPNDTSDDQTPGSTQHTMRYHTYSTAGDFTITLTPVVAGEKMLRFQKNICDYNIKYCSKIVCVELGLLDQFYGTTGRGGPLSFCDNVEHFSIPSTITDSEKGGTSSCMNMRTLKAFVLPRSSSSYLIKAYSFKNCASLEKVSIPTSVYQIGTATDSAANGSSFINCVGLKYLAIPDSVQDIGKNTFDGCGSLRRLYWKGTAGIHASSFNRCMHLEEINLSQNQSLSTVGGSDFYGCGSLKRVVCSTPIEASGDSCFQNCVLLESVPELSVVTSNMFNGCVSLRRVKVTTTSDIGSSAFRFSGLIELDMSGCQSTVALGGSALDSVPDDLVIIVPNGQLSTWQQATGWTNFASKMVEASA
jgi:hypothetical protein